MKVDPYLNTTKQPTLNKSKDLKIRPELLELLNEKLKKTLQDMAQAKIFLNRAVDDQE